MRGARYSRRRICPYACLRESEQPRAQQALPREAIFEEALRFSHRLRYLFSLSGAEIRFAWSDVCPGRSRSAPSPLWRPARKWGEPIKLVGCVQSRIFFGLWFFVARGRSDGKKRKRQLRSEVVKVRGGLLGLSSCNSKVSVIKKHIL